MFAKVAATFLSFAVFVAASPIAPIAPLAASSLGVTKREVFSFNNYNNDPFLSNFDNFFGSNDFSNSNFEQIIIDEEQSQVFCETQSVESIQQRLAILGEVIREILTEQICEVESQVIVFEQFYASLGNFFGDLERSNGRQPGFDSIIASKFSDIFNSDGSLSNNDLGFLGSAIGQSVIAPFGSNWNNLSSPVSVAQARAAALAASNSTSS